MEQSQYKPATRKLKLEELGRAGLEEYHRQDKLPVAIVLDNVRSMHNVGSIFRTSDAFAITKLYLCGITGSPPHREIEKTALGATRSVEWIYKDTVEQAISDLKKEEYCILAVEQAEHSIQLDKYKPGIGWKLALIFGNEVNGVSDEALALADACIEIPQFGTKHSFNIVVSAGIVLWDLYLKIRVPGQLKSSG